MPRSTRSTKKTPAAGERRPLRRGVGYIRVSRVNGRDGDSFISPDVQREAIVALAKVNGIKIVAWYIDLDQSGKKESRPEFDKALAALEAGEAQVMVVYRMSRFARSVVNGEKALQRIEGPDPKNPRCQLVAGDLNIDTTTPQGRLMRGLLQLIAQWELEVHEENWKVAKAKALGRGVKLSRHAPLGYRFNVDEDGELLDAARPARSLVPDPLTRDLIPELFTRRAAGAPWSELRRFWLDATGERITRQRLADVIQNRAYLGENSYGADLVEEDAQEALVSPEQWEAAQPKRVAAPRPARDGNGGSLLSGILVCGACGGKMTAGSTGKDGGTTYRCQRSDRLEPCPAPQRVMAKLADPVVEQAFLAWAKGRAEVEGTADESALDAALVACEQIEAELVATIEAQSAARRPHLFQAKVARLEDALDAAEEKVAALRASGAVETRRVDAVALWPELSTPEKRQLIAAAVEEGRGRVVLHPPAGRSSARGVPFAERATVVFAD